MGIVIVYESKAGHTKRYAEMLGSMTGTPCYTAKEARKKVSKDENVLFMGWLMGNEIQGYKKALQKYNVAAVAAVGISEMSDALIDVINEHNVIPEGVRLFYLRGGINVGKLKGINGFMMRAMKKALENNPERSEGEDAMLDILKNNADFVSEENLEEVKSWVLYNA